MNIKILVCLATLCISLVFVRCRPNLDTRLPEDSFDDEETFTKINGPVEKGSLWPLPQKYKTSASYKAIDYNFVFSPKEYTCDILDEAFARYYKIAFGSHLKTLRFLNSNVPSLEVLDVILLNPCEKYPSMESDESYTLTIDEVSSVLKAKSVWGILRGLETFSQLVHIIDGRLAVNYSWIEDFPRFAWRGILLDSSRHFLPLHTILKSLDAMSYNKFNVFHWHIVDENSFPYESYTFPQLSLKGAYRAYTHVYTQEDIKQVIEYARLRGIRVVVEFDTPGHTRSWGYGQPDLLTECYHGDKPSGDFGPIDPSKNTTYEFVKSFFAEIKEVFPDMYLHLGGDEVYFGCWKSNPLITEFMKKIGIEGNYNKLESYYIEKLLDIIAGFKKNYIVWQDVFDNGVKVKPDTVIHVWRGGYEKELEKVTGAGMKAILSSPWYLDYVGYGRLWSNYYKADPGKFNGTTEQKELVMGGEACLWGEYVDSTNVHSRLWPSASAIAERLWSDESLTNPDLAWGRMEEHRCRMLGRGILAGPPSGPGFCDVEVPL